MKPKFVLAYLDLTSKSNRFTDAQLNNFFLRLSRFGVEYLRQFATGWNDDGQSLPILPYKKTNGRNDFSKLDLRWDAELARAVKAGDRRGIGQYLDPCDQCSVGHPWDPWTNNNHGIEGWWDTSDRALAAFKGFVDRITDILGDPRKHIMGLGNELVHPRDNDPVYLRSWAVAWGVPRVQYILGKGYPRPIPLSAGGKTGHKLMTYLNWGEDGQGLPEGDNVCLVQHGVGLTSHVPPCGPDEPVPWTILEGYLQKFSGRRLYGYSDDGVSCNEWNVVPKALGSTKDQKGRWAASTAEKVRTLQLFKRVWGQRLRVVEFLPREISFDEPLTKLSRKSLEGFKRVRKIWG